MNMKQKLYLLVVGISIVGAMIIGFLGRKTFTDVCKEVDYISHFYVAELPEDIVETVVEGLEEQLEKAPYILIVTPTKEMDYFFHSGCQEVLVQEVKKGPMELTDRIISLSFRSWSIVKYDKQITMQCGFVNRMQDGVSYLVFLEEPYEAANRKEIYPFCADNFLATMFRTDNAENVVCQTDAFTTYVPYQEVCNNEFFVTTEKGLDMLLGFKQKMLERYE